jgi:hypothetical protein
VAKSVGSCVKCPQSLGQSVLSMDIDEGKVREVQVFFFFS